MKSFVFLIILFMGCGLCSGCGKKGEPTPPKSSEVFPQVYPAD